MICEFIINVIHMLCTKFICVVILKILCYSQYIYRDLLMLLYLSFCCYSLGASHSPRSLSSASYVGPKQDLVKLELGFTVENTSLEPVTALSYAVFDNSPFLWYSVKFERIIAVEQYIVRRSNSVEFPGSFLSYRYDEARDFAIYTEAGMKKVLFVNILYLYIYIIYIYIQVSLQCLLNFILWNFLT